ncbi:probable DNA mismatch repair protein Msh6 [Plutella xylostella]|uniref:probable DNA mismatch repair protein Msh6 n=1 Tax=Plutella xylostella TaxID=51655 RepID=UPI0020330692|nr:probable DNA mismatch repair protein Msh6 [Plutella xylostella]
MSKRNSSGASNTLFNYFSKTPPAGKKSRPAAGNNASPALDSSLNNGKDLKVETKKRERQSTSPQREEDSDDDVPVATKRRKRIRLNPIDSDDSDTENKADNTISTPKEKEKVSLESKLSDSFKYEPNQTPKGSKDTAKSVGSRPSSTPSKPAKPDPEPIASDEGNWVHCKLDWLKPAKIRDAEKRRPDHPDYDARTLYVPPEFLKAQTPAHRQWWEMKSSHFDCVLFFKVGKFYELYHMDAAVGVSELGFSYMKGEFAHSGFPESAYARMNATLVSKGYKVARVEQTETPEMMQERCRKSGAKQKVVTREICNVSLRGTQVCGLQDNGPSSSTANYMITVAEEESHGRSSYGVCFIDTSLGQFRLGQFSDDKHSSRLLTTLAHHPPALVIYDRKSTSPRTVNLLTTHCPSARREALPLWAPEKTLKVLAEKYYKTNVDGDWPDGIREFLHDGDALGLTPANNCYLAIKALGGCVSYLTDCLLDIQILEMGQFTSYSPPDVLNKTLSQETKVENRWEGGNTMVLDAITLRNLRIVQDEGCLYDKLNYCSTPFGKRLLYQWVCSPSANMAEISERQGAVRALFHNNELSQEAQAVLAPLPDLERLLAKVHALGNLKRSKHHPDARAIFYEEKTYTKRKVLDFIAVLNGFTAVMKLLDLFENTDSEMLNRLTRLPPHGKFPDYREELAFFKQSFNHAEAEKEGRMLPGAGIDSEYDDSLREIDSIQAELQEYLKEQEKFFRCRVTFVGTDKKRFQLEVASGAAARATSHYQLEGTRKGYSKFSTAETKELLARMMAAEEQKATVLKDFSRRIFEKFSQKYSLWEAAVKRVAVLDVLLSLAQFARQQSGDVCLPEVTFEPDVKPFIQITEGRHPCIPVNDFIPNDTELGVEETSLMLLTGPNMGGKSTLMRQVGLLTVLAHLGSYVPAQHCRLSAVDRIFTRLGANDDILSGQSTFLVEMNETAAIVAHATEHSLVLLDELGRGTSTYDGTAIASGVCAELAARRCRCVFSTHYHSLVRHLARHPRVLLRHMACMVETDETTADNEDEIPEETITFLYKLAPGACPKSYGFNAARLAGIPREITRRAQQISRNLEKEATCVRAFRDIMKMGSNAKELRDLLGKLSI